MTNSAPQWTTGPDSSTRCTQTVLMQFGIFDRVPKTGSGLLQALRDNGWGFESYWPEGEDYRLTVRRFVLGHPTGQFYIFTDGHALAVIDGVLVDSAGEGPNRRRVLGAYRVYRAGEKAA